MKRTWTSLSLVALAGTILLAPGSLPGAPQIVSSSEIPALIVRNVQIDSDEGEIRGTVALRFGYGAPLLPHVHVYGLDASGQVIAEGCDKLSGVLFSNPRPVGNSREGFCVNLGNVAGVARVHVVASAGHSHDCIMGGNRIFKLF